MFMWSVIIILVNSGRRSREGVLLLNPMFENKCLENVQLHWNLLYTFGSKILVLMIQQISLISIIFGSNLTLMLWDKFLINEPELPLQLL